MPAPHSSKGIERICRAYAAMLCAYPPAFRIQFAREMQQVFRDTCRAAVINNNLLRFIPLMFWDWLQTSFQERLAALGNPEVRIKGWWLLALCGVLDAMSAALNLLMMNLSANFIWDMSVLALVAGACAVIAGLWNSGRGGSWLLSLHGLALGAFGLIGVSPLVRRPLGFRPISLLFVLMAVSAGAFALETAQTRGRAPNRWFLTASGAASLVFACSFIAVGFGWIRLGPPPSYWIWMSSYFAFTALCMLSIAARLHWVGPSQSGSPPAHV
jgi:uncharacterized membrane protein HdeD (DUF308 family)